VGSEGTILATGDGGATWHKQRSKRGQGFSSVTFPDATHGWAVGDEWEGGFWDFDFAHCIPVILATEDGGATWSKQSFSLTLKVSGLKGGAVKLGESVTAGGVVTPSSLAGGKVKLTVQQKKGTGWVKVKGRVCTIGARGAYRWQHKPAERGAYRLRATIAGTNAHAAATTKWLGFRVK